MIQMSLIRYLRSNGVFFIKGWGNFDGPSTYRRSFDGFAPEENCSVPRTDRTTCRTMHGGSLLPLQSSSWPPEKGLVDDFPKLSTTSPSLSAPFSTLHWLFSPPQSLPSDWPALWHLYDSLLDWLLTYHAVIIKHSRRRIEWGEWNLRWEFKDNKRKVGPWKGGWWEMERWGVPLRVHKLILNIFILI